MNDKIKFKIGEFSKLNYVTVKTLRHYEEIGLLIPNEVDQWSGYRYYDVSQLKKMSRIIYLKKLGFSLEQIREMFEDGCQTPDLEMIRSQLDSCKSERQLLQWRYEELKRLEDSIEKENMTMEKITIKSLPAIIVASHRRTIANYGELFNLCPNIIGPEMERLGCECAEPGYCFTIDHDKEYRDADVDIEYCEAVTQMKQDSDLIKFKQLVEVPLALCMNHFGSYDLLPQSFAELFAYIEQNGYEIIDSPRFCYIDGIWNKEDIKDWLTEVQVPVRKI